MKIGDVTHPSWRHYHREFISAVPPPPPPTCAAGLCGRRAIERGHGCWRWRECGCGREPECGCEHGCTLCNNATHFCLLSRVFCFSRSGRPVVAHVRPIFSPASQESPFLTRKLAAVGAASAGRQVGGRGAAPTGAHLARRTCTGRESGHKELRVGVSRVS